MKWQLPWLRCRIKVSLVGSRKEWKNQISVSRRSAGNVHGATLPLAYGPPQITGLIR